MSAFETTALLKIASLQCFPLALFARSKKVTDEALIAETMVRFIFFYFIQMCSLLLMDLNFFIIICYHCSWCCAVWWPYKFAPNSSLVQIIFYVSSFEIIDSECIL